MWIFFRDSFISLTRHNDDPSLLLVRSRIASDITSLWPDATVSATPAADYHYRAIVPQAEVLRVIDERIAGIQYTTDFKGGVKEPDRHNAYLRVWSAMNQLQRTREHRP
jgi:hypothetical protein